jgi:hypothetical protein
VVIRHCSSAILCSDFVTNFAPDPSPRLLRNDGQLLLEVPFTPAAGYEEIDSIAKAAKHGPVDPFASASSL